MKKFFKTLFTDTNNINEKSVIGFMSFIMMVITLCINLYTGIQGKEMPINEFVYNGFVALAIGSFGIASIDKFIINKHGKDDYDDETINEDEEQQTD
jgi:ABC-type uncharacterized transport system permease subunit